MLIPSLAYFLPGSTLANGMFELASGGIISGASRLIYGVTILLLLLLFGVLVGIQLVGLPEESYFVTTSLITLEWWVPILGILIFSLGMYLFMFIRRIDMPGVLIVLAITFLGQQAGNYLLGGLFGAFLGSTLMTISGTLIERSKLQTPYSASILPAFWILVPGSLGFISLATLFGQNYLNAISNMMLVVMTLVAISLGLLIGAVIAEPLNPSIRDKISNKYKFIKTK